MQSLQNEEIEATVKTADELWAAYREKRKDVEWAKKEVTVKIGYFQDRGFGNFITKYAVPTRYMVMYDEYNHAAFLKYLKRLKTVGYKSKDEWIERQADYVKYLWRAYNPRGSAKEAADARQTAYENIKREMDSFENDYDKAKIKAEERRKLALSDNRQALLELLEDSEIVNKLARVQAAEEASASLPPTEEEAKEALPPTEEEAKEDAPALPPIVEEAKELTATQRKNAARRKREKIKRALEAVPEVKQKTAEEVWRVEHTLAKEKIREERRKERARAKVAEREAEKDRMRKKWEETHAKHGEDAPPLENVDFDSADDVEDLPSD